MSDGPARFVAVVTLRLTERDWESLLVRRAKEPLLDRWLYVTGGIEADEAAGTTAARELREENGCGVFRARLRGLRHKRRRHGAERGNSAHRWLDFESAITAVPAPNEREVSRRVHEELLAHPIDPWFDLGPATGI